MASLLLALHGYTMNGAGLRVRFGPLAAELASRVELRFPDAPHACPEASVARAYAVWRTPRAEPPYLRWWDASDDGRHYVGWEASVASLQALVDGHSQVGIIGFSQGAMFATALAGLSALGRFPKLAYVILIAGQTPRAEAFSALFDAPIGIPSLHIWGEKDRGAMERAPQLVERFDSASRASRIWPGSHAIPSLGAPAQSIIDFVQQHGAQS